MVRIRIRIRVGLAVGSSKQVQIRTKQSIQLNARENRIERGSNLHILFLVSKSTAIHREFHRHKALQLSSDELKLYPIWATPMSLPFFPHPPWGSLIQMHRPSWHEPLRESASVSAKSCTYALRVTLPSTFQDKILRPILLNRSSFNHCCHVFCASASSAGTTCRLRYGAPHGTGSFFHFR